MHADAAAQTVETDAVVIGAGPVGLFQVFELGLLEIKAHVIDSLPRIGGQCAELYGDKPIYDIPSVPLCTGQQLIDNLRAQIEPFGATFHLGQEIAAVQAQADGRFAVEGAARTRFLCKAVFIAAGVGAFQPKVLKVPGIERFVGQQLFYRRPDTASFAGQHVAVVGHGEAALACALELCAEGPQAVASVTLMHRRDEFQAAPETVARVREACRQQRLRFVVGQITGFDEAQGRLARIVVMGSDGSEQRYELDTLLVLQGLSPRLGPIADWGLDLERRQLVVDTARFETSVPGIFAVGDINTYPGKRKLIVCGFHEATLAAFAAAARVHPDRPVQLQYTTTSPRLHQLLGVAPAPLGL